MAHEEENPLHEQTVQRANEQQQEPEIGEDEDLLVEDIDRQDALDRVSMFVLAEKANDEITKHVGWKLQRGVTHRVAVDEESLEQVFHVEVEVHQVVQTEQLPENVHEIDQFDADVENGQFGHHAVALADAKVLIETCGNVSDQMTTVGRRFCVRSTAHLKAIEMLLQGKAKLRRTSPPEEARQEEAEGLQHENERHVLIETDDVRAASRARLIVDFGYFAVDRDEVRVRDPADEIGVGDVSIGE